MTCSHALDLIDAAPMVDLSPAALEALLAHARTCGSCAAARDMAASLPDDLAALPAVEAPASFAQRIDARIAAMTVPVRTKGNEERAAGPDWRAWLTLSGSAAAAAILIPSYTLTPDLTLFVRTPMGPVSRNESVLSSDTTDTADATRPSRTDLSSRS